MKKLVFLLTLLISTSVFAEDFSFTLPGTEAPPVEQQQSSSTTNNTPINSSVTNSSTYNNGSYGGSTSLKEEAKAETKTIHYVLDSTEKYHNYIDTGMVYKNIISYDSIYEIVNQIVVKKQSERIESSKEIMVLIDGRIIIFEKDKNLSFDDFVNKFKKTKIIIKAQEPRTHGQFALADYLEINKNARLIVIDKEVELFNEPVIDNDIVLFPMREIVVGLGGEIKWDEQNRKATITKGNLSIVLTMDSSIIKVNGKDLDLEAKFIIVEGKDGERIFGHMDYIVEKLGGAVYWDAKEMAIVIEPKQ